MNIDEKIKELDAARDILLEEIRERKAKVNAYALKIRKLETVKRHAGEILEGDDDVLTLNQTQESEDKKIFVDPAQIDLEIGPIGESALAIGDTVSGFGTITNEDELKQAETFLKERRELEFGGIDEATSAAIEQATGPAEELDEATEEIITETIEQAAEIVDNIVAIAKSAKRKKSDNGAIPAPPDEEQALANDSINDFLKS